MKVDNEQRKASFDVSDAENNKSKICKDFDTLHVCTVQYPLRLRLTVVSPIREAGYGPRPLTIESG